MSPRHAATLAKIREAKRQKALTPGVGVACDGLTPAELDALLGPEKRRRRRRRTGIKGVTRKPSGKYQARSSFRGRDVALGTFETAEEAGAAVRRFEESLARGGAA